jgi:hypothetical protein
MYKSADKFKSLFAITSLKPGVCRIIRFEECNLVAGFWIILVSVNEPRTAYASSSVSGHQDLRGK